MANGTTARDTVNIRISIAAWKRLTNLKQTPGDDFDTVVTRLLDGADMLLALGRIELGEPRTDEAKS